MKKFIAATTREAMRKMKADLGVEAYVISNRSTPGGVEILAMTGHAVDDLTRAAGNRPNAPRSPNRDRPETPAARPFAGFGTPPLKTLRDVAVHLPPDTATVENALRQSIPPAPGARPAASKGPDGVNGGAKPLPPPELPPTVTPAAKAVVTGRADTAPGEQRLLDEFRSVKSLLETQLAGFVWRDTAQRKPLVAKMWRELTDAGFSPAVARSVVGRLPDDYSEAQARTWMQSVLAHNIRCAAAEQDIVARGGIFALVGPTGVGKTTTTAKLAARCVVKFGAGSLGLITTDGYRIGAFDQLAIYGKILGVPVHSAQSSAELEAILASMRGKRLILIDTVGMGQRDARVADQLTLLNHPSVQRMLLLNAAAQAETLDDVVRAYGTASPRGEVATQAAMRPLAGAIITKLDEAVKLAPALDTCARYGLEIQCVTSGQRVPEDLHPANAQALAHRAMRVPAHPVFDLQDDELPMRAQLMGGGAGEGF